MNCKIFTENLSEFIEDDLEESIKYKMKEHMMTCQDCRQLYDEELIIEKAFVEALGLEDISFSSQKENIMSRIDQDKYKDMKPKKVNKNLLGYVKFIGPVAAAILFIVLINPLSRFKVIENGSQYTKESLEQIAVENKESSDKGLETTGSDSKNDLNSSKNYEISIKSETSNDTSKKDSSSSVNENSVRVLDESSSDGANNAVSDNSSTSKDGYENTDSTNSSTSQAANDTSAQENSNDNDNSNHDKSLNTIAAANAITKEFNFKKQIITKDDISGSLIKWINSPNNALTAALAEKKDPSIEKIYVKDLNKEVLWSLEVNLQGRNVFTRFIKWGNNENLFVIVDEVRDNIIKSEEVYVLNINTGDAKQIYNIIGSNKKIEDINILNNRDIELKVSVRDNDNENKNYMESYIVKGFFS